MGPRYGPTIAGPSCPSRPSRPARWRPLAVLAALGALAALVGACGEDPTPADGRAEQLRDAATAAGLSDEVADVLGLAAASTDATYRVSYELAESDGDVESDSNATQVVTVTQRPPERRLDVVHADGTADATISTVDANYQCTTVEGDWRCDVLSEPVRAGLFDEQVIDAYVTSLTASARNYAFSVEQRELVGVTATCLISTRRSDAPDDPSLGAGDTLCLSPEGAQLLTETPSDTLRAVEYTTDIPEDAFVLPAEPA